MHKTKELHILFLPVFQVQKFLPDLFGQWQSPVAGFCLRCVGKNEFRFSPGSCLGISMLDRDRVVFKINSIPFKTQNLAPPETIKSCHLIQQTIFMVLCRFKKYGQFFSPVVVGNVLFCLRSFNTVNFKKSHHYNPFEYIHSEKDILKQVNALISNTRGEGRTGDEFWIHAETLLYCALIGYIHYEAPKKEQNFATLIELVNQLEVHEQDDQFENPVDIVFKSLAQKDPDHFAVRYYKKYKLAAG